MRLENVEKVTSQARELGLSEKTIARIEEQMRNDVPRIQETENIRGHRGNTEATVFLQQSNRSDSYYLHKIQYAHHRGKTPAEGHKFFVTLPERDGRKEFRSVENTLEAINLFKSQKGNSELSWGKTFKSSGLLARMEEGKVTEVNKDFQRTFNLTPQTQTVWVEEGKGFSVPQTVNLMERRYVHRDDLLNSLKGEVYAAWTCLNMDAAKDRHGNYELLQYSDPAYGFDLKAQLERFNLPGMEKPEKLEQAMAAIRNGDRLLVTAEQNGQPVKVYMEAEVRYGTMNFFDLDGNRIKRETLLKEDLQQDKGKARGQEVTESQELSR